MHRHLAIAVPAALLLLVACANVEPFDPPVAGEMLPGPGLFSGPSGEFVLQRPLGEAPKAESEGPEAPAPTPPLRRKLTDPPPG